MNIALLFFITLRNNFLLSAANGLKSESIVGGTVARQNQFAYQVSIQMNLEHRCGGGIISNEFIITAAHCFINETSGLVIKNIFTVYLSINNANDPEGTAVEATVEKIFVPNTYNPVKPNPGEPYRTEGDIAVAKLKHKLNLTNNPNLRRLELPDAGFSYKDKTFIIAGYGYNNVTLNIDIKAKRIKNLGTSDGQLRYSEVAYVSNNNDIECRKRYFDPVDFPYICGQMIQLKNTTWRGICMGDSGGPLVFEDRILVAVLTYGPTTCDESLMPAIYISVSYYLQFIHDIMRGIRAVNMRIVTWTRTHSLPYFKISDN